MLEYDELGDRVQNFNPTIQQIVSSIEDSFAGVRDNVNEYEETLNDLEWLYRKAKEEGDYASAAMYQVNKKIAMQMANGYIKSEKKMGTTIERSTRQARKGLTSGCQQMMLAYNKMAVNKATLEKQVELYGGRHVRHPGADRHGHPGGYPLRQCEHALRPDFPGIPHRSDGLDQKEPSADDRLGQ